MATITKQLAQATPTSAMTTELDNYAFGTGVVTASAINNLAGGGTANFDGYPNAKVALAIAAVGTQVAANTVAGLWFIRALDATPHYEDVTTPPARQPDVVFYPKGTASAQYLLGVVPTGANAGTARVRLPVGNFKCYFYWPGGGAAGLATLTTGNVITITPETEESV